MAITFRDLKGSALTHPEMDTNLASYYLSSSVSGSTITFFQSGSDGNVISSSHDLADSDAQTLNIVGDQLTISNGNTVTVPTGSDTTYTEGTGIDITNEVITNTAPDQEVILTQGGATTITGTYPNFTISSTDTTYTNLSEFTNDVGFITSSEGTLYTAGTGLTLSGSEFSLTDPHFSGDYNDLTNQPTVGLSLVTNSLTLTKLDGTTDTVDLTPYLDEDARAIASGTLDSVTGIVTFTRDDATTFTLDLSDLLDDTNLVTSVNGFNGVVELTTDDVPEGATNFYDKTVSITGQNITVNGTYPNFQITGSAAYTETDPIFIASDAAGITSTDISNWDTAHGWGDHSTQGYLTSVADTFDRFQAIGVSGQTTIYADNNADTLNFAPGGIVSITTNATNDTITISATETDTLATVTGRGSSTTTSITAANFITTSDRRLKSDIEPLKDGLDTIKKFVSYEYTKGGVQDAGFMAQEVQEAIPYAIAEGEDGFLTMRDRPVLAYMHKAILELEARLAAIEEKLG